MSVRTSLQYLVTKNIFVQSLKFKVLKMATIQKFEDIEAWKLGREFCKKIGSLIDSGKFKKNYRLIDQIEGSSGSIMDNIAEGFERDSRGNSLHFLVILKVLEENFVHNYIEQKTEIT